METAIYESTIDSYVKRGLPDSPDLKIGMLDTNVWTDVARTARQSPNFHSHILKEMLHDIHMIVLPEVILRECAGSGRQKDMTDERFNNLYHSAFQAITAETDVYVVTFTDMENMMLNSNGGDKDRALRQALLIANELFVNNSDVLTALANVRQFNEIEDALTVIAEDAGERVILFFTMLFLTEFWEVDVFTNEVAVYTERTTIGRKEKLREALGSIVIEEFYEAYRIHSYDAILFNVMIELDSQWSNQMRKDFVTQCRNNRNRKIRVYSAKANYADTIPCHNNLHFLTKFEEWKDNGTTIIF